MRQVGKPRLLLRPGAPGTKRFVEKHGEALVAVRYRYDEKSLKRYTAVELVVDESKWIPERCISDPDTGRWDCASVTRRPSFAPGSAEARWDPMAKLRWMTLAQATHLGHEARIAACEPRVLPYPMSDEDIQQ